MEKQIVICEFLTLSDLFRRFSRPLSDQSENTPSVVGWPRKSEPQGVRKFYNHQIDEISESEKNDIFQDAASIGTVRAYIYSQAIGRGRLPDLSRTREVPV